MDFTNKECLEIVIAFRANPPYCITQTVDKLSTEFKFVQEGFCDIDERGTATPNNKGNEFLHALVAKFTEELYQLAHDMALHDAYKECCLDALIDRLTIKYEYEDREELKNYIEYIVSNTWRYPSFEMKIKNKRIIFS